MIAIGRGTSPQSLQTKRCGEFVALDRTEDGVWIVPPFAEQPTAQSAATGNSSTVPGAGTLVSPTAGGATTSVTAPSGGSAVAQPGVALSLRIVEIRGNVPLESWTDLFRCLISPAARLKLKSLQLGIDIKLLARDDQPLDANDATLKAMREAAQQLGLEIAQEPNDG